MAHDIQTINPTTSAPIATYTRMSDAEVNQAIQACQDAFEEWKLVSLEDRAEILLGVAAELRNSKEDLAQLMTREVGKLLKDSRDEVDLCAAICEFTAEKGPKDLAPEEREIPGGRGLITYAPVGLIYGIQPWNFPSYQAVRYSIANLMAGNGVLLKHAESCTGSGLLLKEIFERGGLPENLFTVLLIDHEQSDKVIEHKLVRGVTLTGSDVAGRKVAEKAAANLKKTVLELGSNDAYLVLSDADLDKAVEACVQGRIYNNGQTCVNAKRFIVTENHYDAFLERFVDRMKDMKLGDPSRPDTELGPMSRAELRDQLAEQVRESVAKGAKIECGGEVPDQPGAFYPATVLSNVQPGQPAYDDELFGPVAAIIKVRDDEEAVRVANDSRYGLGGGIFSRDEKRAREIAQNHFDTGMVSINGFNIAIPNMPFGGVKDSGYGREHGGFGMKEFVNAKSIYMT